MRHGRFISTALVATAAMAIGPAWASAAQSPLTDDSQADFAGAGAQTGTWAVEPGAVRLKGAAAAENFDAGIPAGWAGTPWNDGQSGPQTGGNATVAGGQLVVDGAHFNNINATPNFSAPQTLEFRATLGNDQYQNIGFADTFGTSVEPWAMFSTLPTLEGTGLFARTAQGTPAVVDTALSVDLSIAHVYRIEWTALDVKFYVDGALLATHTTSIAGPMRPVVSDLNVSPAKVVTVDWLSLSAPSSGTFTSRVLSADSAHTVWGNLTSTSTGTAFETRTGNTATPRRQLVGLPGRRRRRGHPEPERAVHPVPRDAERSERQPRQRLAGLRGRQRRADRGDQLGRRERQQRDRRVLEP